MNEEFKFHAVIQAGDGGGAFVFFPFNMLESFGTTGKVRVSGTIDGVRTAENFSSTVFRSICWAC
jgi:hypothetical protein